MLGLIIAVVIGILLIGLVLKIIKLALIIALGVGIVMLAQAKFETKRLK